MPFDDVAGPEKLHGFFIKNVNPEAAVAVEPAAAIATLLLGQPTGQRL